MGRNLLQQNSWRKIQRIFLPQGHIERQKCFLTRSKNKNPGNSNAGFIELEVLVWVSIIVLILVGFFQIYRMYKVEHHEIKEEFKNEWNKLESQRRTKKNQ